MYTEPIQDWWEHTQAVARGALRRFLAATGKRSATLHNASILHDLGKADPLIQKWYQVFCQIAHGYSPPVDSLLAHTFFRRHDKEYQRAERVTNERLADILPDGRRPGHQRQGTAIALDHKQRDVALLVSGHHGGLPDFYASIVEDENGAGRLVKYLGRRFIDRDEAPETMAEQKALATRGYNESLPPAKELLATVLAKYSDCRLQKCPASSPAVESDFFIRLMFSCLIDADWADTEKWMKSQDGGYTELKIPRLADLYGRIRNIDAHQAVLRSECQNDTIRGLRDTVYRYCVKASQERAGAFTLNAPTGANKTLGALAWAMRHAKKHRMRRIIYVAPYLSIIEQNAQRIREALEYNQKSPLSPDELHNLAIFEHHSIADPISLNGIKPEDMDSYDRRQASMLRSRISNWDAPFIITTNVQLLDSFFSCYPGRCRKLHNIARSVIILDECQNVHPSYLKATCQMLNQWIEHAGVSVLLCTATQPQWHVPHKGFSEFLRAHPIIRDPGKLFKRAARVKVSWPVRQTNRLTFKDLVHKMVSHRQVGTIVDTRRKARELYGNLKVQGPSDSIFHLSTSMNPLHRIVTFHALLDRLDTGAKTYLAATPILEAGVDISFTHFYREMAGLEQIGQAGGRVNRHGERDSGKLTVFYLLDNDGAMLTSDRHCPQDKWYKHGRNVLKQFLADCADKGIALPDINRPDEMAVYFRNLYSRDDLDENRICDNRKLWQFTTVSNSYRTIEDQSRPVLCIHWNQKYGELVRGPDIKKRLTNWLRYAEIPEPALDAPVRLLIDNVLEKLRERPYSRWLHNLISYFSANVFWRNFQQLEEKGVIVADEETGVEMWTGEYDNDVGLIY